MRAWKEGRPKPVIGIAGGIGSGKSSVARQFGGLGCVVVDADQLAHEVLQTAEVKAALLEWLGPEMFAADGSVVRKAVAKRVFTGPEQIAKLNGLIHPRVGAMREQMTAAAMADASVKAVVWDIPLLYEIGLEKACDAVVFVRVGREERLARLQETRGWGREEVERREKLQIPLDKKAQVADYCVDNSGNEVHSLSQVREILSQLVAVNG